MPERDAHAPPERSPMDPLVQILAALFLLCVLFLVGIFVVAGVSLIVSAL